MKTKELVMRLDQEVLSDIYADKVIQGRVAHYMNVQVDQDLAEFMLSANTHNRAMSMGHSKKFDKILKDGKFRLDPSSSLGFRIDYKGQGECDMVEGQHRLAAIVRTGISGSFNVVVGVTTDNIDDAVLSKRRTLAESLAMSTGIKKNVTLYKQIVDREKHYSAGAYSPTAATTSKDQLHDLIMADKDSLDVAVEKVTSLWKNANSRQKKMLNKAAVGFMYWKMYRVDQELADNILGFIVNNDPASNGITHKMINDVCIKLEEIQRISNRERDIRQYSWVTNLFNALHHGKISSTRNLFIDAEVGRVEVKVGGPFVGTNTAGVPRDVYAR